MNTSTLKSRGSGNLLTGLGLALIHLCALAAFVPAFFSWSAVGVAGVLVYVTGGLGVTLGFHRLLTHRSMQLPKGFEYALTILGVLALQGGPIVWVATHRRHHATSDRKGDPHGMDRGFWWAHVGWLFLPNPGRPKIAEQRRLAADLAANPFYVFMERTALLWQVALAVALFALGGWAWVVWGIFVRLVVTYHITWLVNSASHWTGYRTFRTGDLSTNNWWVALLAWGEGWHNNHHAFPSSARHGLRWFEFDPTWLTIRALQFVGIVRSVKLPTLTMLNRLRVLEPARITLPTVTVTPARQLELN
ncbi:MAG TPA: fatty acid desaturase [Candidatus Cybelea sp.]|nr:fatty acid desaturase [Candidatus Cybelea sp.]